MRRQADIFEPLHLAALPHISLRIRSAISSKLSKNVLVSPRVRGIRGIHWRLCKPVDSPCLREYQRSSFDLSGKYDLARSNLLFQLQWPRRPPRRPRSVLSSLSSEHACKLNRCRAFQASLSLRVVHTSSAVEAQRNKTATRLPKSR